MNVVEGLSLKHIVRPANKPNAPLLLLLHGYGSNEEDLFSFAPELIEDFFIVSARAPFDLQPYGAAWYAINFDASGSKFSDTDQALESMQLIKTFIQEVKDYYPVYNGPVCVLGFSQGAILSYALSLSYPELFSKVVAMSGYINEDLIINPSELESRFRESKRTPEYFISHGTMDQVVPYTWALQAPEFLNTLPINFTFKEYPIGHGVSRENFYDMKTWLEK